MTKELSPELLLAESFFDPQAASVPTKSAALMLSAKNFKPRLFILHLPFFDQIFPGMTDGADLLGYDKKIPFEPMADTVCQQVKLVLLMGVTADKIEAAIRGSQYYKEGAPELVHVSSMEEAVQEAQKRAKAGDIVTLSPACASFDLYPNFEARGIHYKNLVKELH